MLRQQTETFEHLAENMQELKHKKYSSISHSHYFKINLIFAVKKRQRYEKVMKIAFAKK